MMTGLKRQIHLNIKILVYYLIYWAFSILRSIEREENHGSQQLSSTQLPSIQVIDVNEEALYFEKSEYEAFVAENQPAGTTVLVVSASDKDQGTNGVLMYSIVGEEYSINPVTGVITTTKPLDREARGVYAVTVYVRDGGSPPNFAKTTVRVTVLDENDNRPLFGRVYYSLEVPENQEPVTFFTIVAKDQDSGDRSDLHYKITDGDHFGQFHLDRKSGVLSTSRPLDREFTSIYTLTIEAQDQGTPSLTSTVTLDINVLDLNDNSPVFPSNSYSVEISEDAPEGSLVLKVSASDPDEGSNSQLVYFLSQESRGMFTVDQNTGRIRTATTLDREKVSSYSFKVYAMDSSATNPHNTSAQLTVNVLDVNDNAPFFKTDPLTIYVFSSAVSNHVVLCSMRAEDKDFGANGSVIYRFANPVKGFTINSLTGDIQATEKLHVLTQSQRTLIVEAMDHGSPSQSSLGVVVVYIREQIYQGIRFYHNTRDVSLPENAAKGTAVIQIHAQYPDGSSSGIKYSIFSGNKQHSFRISPYTGYANLSPFSKMTVLDPEWVIIVIMCRGLTVNEILASSWRKRVGGEKSGVVLLLSGDPTRCQELYQTCLDSSEAQSVTIAEHSPAESSVITVTSTDKDSRENGRITYRVVSPKDMFQIDPYNVVVESCDSGTPPLISQTTVKVHISDFNDNDPVFLQTEYRASVSEDEVPGSTILTLEAMDMDLFQDNCGFDFAIASGNVDNGRNRKQCSLPRRQRVQYSISSGDESEFFSVDRWNGSLSLRRSLVGDQVSSHLLIIQASNGQGHFALAPVTVEVKDINNNLTYFPLKTITASIRENLPQNSLVTTLHVIDQRSNVKGSYGEIEYFLLNKDRFSANSCNGKDFFLVNRTSGEVRTCFPFDFEKAKISATVTVQVFVTSEDEYDPVFTHLDFTFSVPEDAKKGQSIGQVLAKDEDGGIDGIVLYTLANSSPHFEVNAFTGIISLKMDAYQQHVSCAKGETRQMTLNVIAHSPLETSRKTSAQITIDVTHTSFGISTDVNVVLTSAIAASLVGIVIFLLNVVFMFILRSKRYKEQESCTGIVTNVTALETLEDLKFPGGENLQTGNNQQTLPGYAAEQPGNEGGWECTRDGSLDQSNSSRCGSVEVEHIAARGPDTGIQQDDDQLTDISCEPGIDAKQWLKEKKLGSLSGTLLASQLPAYRDGGGYISELDEVLILLMVLLHHSWIVTKN
ncbi:Protocadherin-16 Protein dachsous -like protein 1 [Triplophysa tibetana]|uniref:Protocadherin-16 Protein dachsous-like protein 1 n=1 Tax=Triplophysa tibetana TaxID=1572043 RepID=A0A5A9MZQ5_9TELE|nr:Protocadherin-16 Protein dachsous -like protein 1 [Triplophysa tibetana]